MLQHAPSEPKAAPVAASPRIDPPALPPLPSTAAELHRTGPRHRQRLQNADRVIDMIEDFTAMDSALRVVVVHGKGGTR